MKSWANSNKCRICPTFLTVLYAARAADSRPYGHSRRFETAPFSYGAVSHETWDRFAGSSFQPAAGGEEFPLLAHTEGCDGIALQLVVMRAVGGMEEARQVFFADLAYPIKHSVDTIKITNCADTCCPNVCANHVAIASIHPPDSCL